MGTMKKKNASWLGLMGLVALSTASLLAGLRHALGRREQPASAQDAQDSDRAKIQKVLGDVVRPLDLSVWPEHLRPRPGMPDRDTLRRSLSRSSRPA